MFNPFENIPQKITDLIWAVNQADQNYLDTAEQSKAAELATTLQDLAHHLGQFISHLDLQNEFARLGILIRSFDDAARVMVALNTLITDRLEADPSEKTKKHIEKLFYICAEVARIRAEFTAKKNNTPR